MGWVRRGFRKPYFSVRMRENLAAFIVDGKSEEIEDWSLFKYVSKVDRSSRVGACGGGGGRGGWRVASEEKRAVREAILLLVNVEQQS